MKITVFGAGYVGLVTATCLADLGNEVVCVDVDQEKVARLNQGKLPMYEIGLDELLHRNLQQKRLRFTTEPQPAIKNSEVIFICVGTPAKPNGQAELKYIFQVAATIGKHLNSYKVIVDKSTVPVGTADKVRRLIKKHRKKRQKFDVVANPEFLKEGAAVRDFQNPERVIIGASSKKAAQVMKRLYRPIARTGRPIIVTTVKSAELIKYASNAMLAARISFMNELSHLCELVGADIKEVAKGMGLDTRIGPRFLQAGAGYGGSCFPKDVKALAQTMERYNLDTNMLRAVDYINERQKRSIVTKLKRFLPKLEGKRIAIWGLAFKPRTDDIRESPALTVIEQLQHEYAEVVAFDPEAMGNARKALKGVKFAKSAYEALKGADALVLLTEWDEFREPNFRKMKRLMKNKIIIDGRNVYEPKEMKKQGFKYAGIGRG